MKRLSAVTTCLVVALAACSADVGDVSVGPLPTCDTTSRGLMLLMAQAVPSAELIPCLEELPDGWELERARVQTGLGVLSLDNRGVGDVTITLTESCDHPGNFVEGVGPAGSEVFDLVVADTLTRHVVFLGGCVVIESPVRLAAAEMTTEISFVTRKQLITWSGLDL